MAQAWFDDHPIELYLRESGEVPDLVPGGLTEFSGNPTRGDVPYNFATIQTWFPRLPDMLQPLLAFIVMGWRRLSASPSSEFAERFKYIVISSPLLSSSLSSSSITRAATPTTPGHYDQGNPALSPTASSSLRTISNTGSHISAFTLACLVSVVLTQDYYFPCLLLLIAILSNWVSELNSPSLKSGNERGLWTMTLDCLETLVVANETWDNVVNDALGILEVEEQSVSPLSSPSSSLPSLRIALSVSLHTTQTQCDNVRQLLTALTSPLLISQLSNMYAPPSPTRRSASPKRPRTISLAPSSSAYSRSTWHVHRQSISLSNPVDDAYTRSRREPVLQVSVSDKRSTLSDSHIPFTHSSLPYRVRPPPSLSTLVRPENLKSPKSATCAAPSGPSGSSHVLTPPITPPATMDDVASDADHENELFGAAALNLCRRRCNMRIPMFSVPSSPLNVVRCPSQEIPQFHVSNSPSPLISLLGSNFTPSKSTSPTSRSIHPLSLSNLHLALQGALGSKRFACAHLLALRFPDSDSTTQGEDISSNTDGEETYWEDIRSIISLLTSTLEDASARLGVALADVARQQESELVTGDKESCAFASSREHMESSHSTLLPLSAYAPMPSRLARFAAHVDAITSALDEARDHLRQCVASLKEDSEPLKDLQDPKPSPLALQSYERLRRELGLAFRECERGRGTLLEIVQPNTPVRLPEDGNKELSPQQEEQLSSGESDRTLYKSEEVHEQPKHIRVVEDQDRDQLSFHDDDATSHLIETTSSQHLPPPGIEQVFESTSVAQLFVRERSILPRKERIRLAKARRESQLSSRNSEPDRRSGGGLHSMRENWGPGGEVVEELKDVIWQVSERRRKMIQGSPNLQPQSNALLSSP